MFGRRGTDEPKPAAGSTGDRPAPQLRVLTSGGAQRSDGRTPLSPAAEKIRRLAEPVVAKQIDIAAAQHRSRGDLAREIGEIIDKVIEEAAAAIDPAEHRDIVTKFINATLDAGKFDLAKLDQQKAEASRAQAEKRDPRAADKGAQLVSSRASINEAAPRIYPLVMERIDSEVAARLTRGDLAKQLHSVIAEILVEQKIQLNQLEQRDLVTLMLNDMLGLGPLEALLSDETISDIMVNGPKQVFIERRGKLVLTDVTFRDNAHVMSIATRIVTQVGRRIDETSPLVDARLADGSRVNIIAPPLAIDGTSISIRKFSKKSITLDVMASTQSISPPMATVLKIASRARLNILISGGTGSGKTTLLNAMSQMIEIDERIVTIEDAAELQLQQPHVVRLETRPANLEGKGEINMRDLLKNALRMRPDRIILGEIRGAEALDMLQAMNTGHDGSLCTIHANRPREALTRLENMVGMSGINLPSRAVRTQIAAAVHMVLQVSRMRDGIRRVTNVMEVVGMEGDVITTQELFSYKFEGETAEGKLKGRFEPTGLRPHFTPRAEYYGLDKTLLEAIG